MRNLLLTVLLAAAPAGAQEFSLDLPAVGALLAEARVIRVKHQGRPRPPLVSDYAARDLSFNLRADGNDREDGVIYVYKTLELLHRGTPLATLRLNDDVRGWSAAERTLKAFEALRLDALAQNRRVLIDYDALERQNKAHAWADPKNPKECELFDALIRLGRPAGL